MNRDHLTEASWLRPACEIFHGGPAGGAAGRLGLAGLLALLTSGACFADAFTYVGTMGETEVVLEVTDPADGPLLARYAEKAEGVDTELRGVEIFSDRALLNVPSQTARTTALWALEGAIGAPALVGAFEIPELGYSVPLTLTLVGQRGYARDKVEPYDVFAQLPEEDISLKGTPYEFSKMQAPYAGAPQAMSGGVYYMVADPRTQFAYPRVLVLADGTDTHPINEALQTKQWSLGLEALDCLRHTEFLGGYEEQVVTVHHLSHTILSISRGAVIACSGPSISIYNEHLNFDVASGTPLDMSRVFPDWPGHPSKDLAEHVRARVDADYWQDGECDPGVDLPSHLAVTFAEPALVRFHLQGMSPPCNDLILSQDIAELEPFLAEDALTLFAE